VAAQQQLVEHQTLHLVARVVQGKRLVLQEQQLIMQGVVVVLGGMVQDQAQLGLVVPVVVVPVHMVFQQIQQLVIRAPLTLGEVEGAGDGQVVRASPVVLVDQA